MRLKRKGRKYDGVENFPLYGIYSQRLSISDLKNYFLYKISILHGCNPKFITLNFTFTLKLFFTIVLIPRNLCHGSTSFREMCTFLKTDSRCLIDEKPGEQFRTMPVPCDMCLSTNI